MMNNNLKKKAINRLLIGFPMGIAIGVAITIVSSLFFGKGYYSAVVPSFAADMGSEINAVVLQFFLSGVLGSVYALCSVVWDIEHWSVLKQTVVNFLLMSITMVAVAYTCHWMKHTFIGVLQYMGIFVFIYIAIWVSIFSYLKKSVDSINKKIKE